MRKVAETLYVPPGPHEPLQGPLTSSALTQPSGHYLCALGPRLSNKKIQVTELELGLNPMDVPRLIWSCHRGKKDKAGPGMVWGEPQVFKIGLLYNPLPLLSLSLPSWLPRGDEPVLVTRLLSSGVGTREESQESF